MIRPRVLHLRAANFVGGPEQQLLQHAESECEGPWQILIGIFVGRGDGQELNTTARAKGLAAVSVPADNFLTSVRALRRILREQRINLLCTHGYKADILGLLASQLVGIPVACFLRGWTRENWKVQAYERLDRLSLGFADRVVCLSETQAKRISRRFGLADKIRVVFNATAVPEFNPEKQLLAKEEIRRRFSLPPDSVVVATAGRLSPEKGVGDFLMAVAQVRTRCPRARFVVFGDGFLREGLQKKAHELQLEEQVTFAGFQRDLRSLLPGIDLLVNPSLSEEMPNIVLEGMAEGIPVVATAVGGVEELAGDGGALRLVPAGRPEDIAEAMCKLILDPVGAWDLGQKGQKRVEQTFSLAKQREQLHSLYQELCPSPRTINTSSWNDGLLTEKSIAASPSVHAAEKGPPFLSIVIPVRNEELHLGSVLEEIDAQTYPHDCLEILVADGHSSDGTRMVVEKFTKSTSISVRLFSNPAQRSSAGRNLGVRNARGEFVIFIDGHCHLPSPTMLQDAVELFERTGADCLCRPQPLQMRGNTVFQDVVAHARATALGHGLGSTIYARDSEGPVNPLSSGALYRRSVFERIGYFDEHFDAAEDVEFNYRVDIAGLVSYLSPKLAAIYRPREDLKSLWRQMVRYGRGRVRLVRKHARAFSFGQVVPAAMLVWLLVGGLLSVSSTRFAEIYIATVAFYLVVVVAFSLKLGNQNGWRHVTLAPAVYLTIHAGLGAGSLAELLCPPRSPIAAEDLRASTNERKVTGKSV